jgi:hypothetical protein
VAEDQAEDTFGDYPPFAMTGYSQGGYVVSASSDLNTNYHAWETFNNIDDELWICDDYNSDGTTPRYTGGITSSGGGVYQGPISTNSIPITGSGSETITGEYIQIEFPFKFKLEDIAYQREGTYWGYNRLPHSGSIVACNDGINWKTIHNWTGLTDADVGSTDGSNLAVTQSPFRSGIFAVDKDSATYDAYKFFRIICTRIQKTNTSGDGNSYGLWSIIQLELYGHRENDLVRLPDPTNVLKYPHIAMTGPAQRGYVASASTNHSNGNHPTRKVFDGDITNDWQTDSGRYSDSGGGVYTHNAGETTVTNVQSRVGDWVQLESPHKIRVKTMKFTPVATYGQERSPGTGVLVGSNDNGDTWTEIKSFDVTVDGTPNSYTAGSPTTLAIDSGSNSTPGYYKIHRLIWLTLYTASQTTYANRASVADLEFFGTGVDSIPIQIGGGNIDKVANFRVYDKFVGEDQALEIWDAQKDEFGRTKSSMTLQKGRLGIGTTEPEGRLAVLDEPNGLEEFPPRAMTGEETHFEGHGTFKVALSSADNGNGVIPAFNKKATLSDPGDIDYIEWGTSQYTSATGVYTGSVSTQGVYGEWIEIQMPYKIKLEYNLLYHRNRDGTITNDYWVLERMPRDGAILGSNDGENWTTLQSWTDFEWVTGTSAAGQRQSEYWLTPGKFVTNSTAYYKTFRLVFSKLFGANGDRVNLAEWRLFGTREQGQSVLHDGQLTLTKSLNVPRIGPALDADDTPRRDRLVVEYNTSTNPTFEGAVRDTSGRGNDGVFVGTASYDATEKAFVTPNTTGIIRKNINLPGGNIPLSVSAWFRLIDTTTSTNDTIICLGTNSDATSGGSFILLVNTDRLSINFEQSDNYTEFTKTIYNGTWYHVVATYDGGTSASARKLFIDGVEIAQTSTVGTITGVNLAANPDFTVGMRTDISGYINGSISNFKLYDTALTAQEVKTLYDMGRTGHIVNPQPLHITAPLYLPSTTFPNYKFYEEGEFVPVFASVNAPTYTEQFGRYTKIGNVVFVHIMITYSGLNTTDTSAVTIDGIPFHTDGTDTNCALVSYHGDYHNMFSPVNGAGGRVDGGRLLLTHSSDGNYVNYNECIAAGRVNMVAQYFLP